MTQAGPLWVGTRLAFVVLTYVTVVIASQYSTQGLKRLWLNGGGVRNWHEVVNAWGEWDYGWFSRIAGHGYDTQSAAFFPLYPFLMRLGAAAFKQLHTQPSTALLLSGLLVSNLAALIAFAATWRLAADASGEEAVGRLTLLLLAAFPFAFFLTAPYSESLFLATSISGLLFARRGWWVLAMGAAYLAGLTRVTAVILMLPLAWEYARHHGWLDRQRVREGWSTLRRWGELGLGLAVVGAVPAAIATYMGYLWWRFHDALAFVHAERLPAWTRQTMAPWQTARLYVDHLTAQPAWSFWQLLIGLEGLLVVLFAVITVVAARRLPFALTLYGIGLVGLVMVTPESNYVDPFLGVGRYMLVALPVFYAGAIYLARRSTLASSVLFGSILLQGALASFWLTSVWLA